MLRKWLSVIVLVALLTSLFVSFPALSADTKGDNVTYGLNSYEKGQEVIELRTETSRTVYLGNGKYQFQTGGDIIHWKYDYKDEKEQWKETDLTFKDGRITEAPFTLEVKGLEVTMTSRKTGTIQTLTLDKIDGLTSVKSSEWVYSGNTATWKDAALDTDVVLEVLPEGFRYKRILKSDKAILQAEYLQSKSVGTKDDIVVRVSARDANGVELDVAKTVTASKITESTNGKVNLTKDADIIADYKVKYPIEIDPSPLIVGASKDTYIQYALPTTNSGTADRVAARDTKDLQIRSILESDISGLPAGQTLTSASLQQYYYSYTTTDPSGKTVWVYKQTHVDWVETEATWNIYKTGSNWSTVGGDYVTSSPVGGSTTFPASYGWMTWDVLAITEDAYTNSISFEVLEKFNTEGVNSGAGDSVARWYSKEYTGDTSLRPKLTIEYEAASAIISPTVVTNEASSVEETTATMNGEITDDGGENCTRGFEWGTTTGVYGDSWEESSFGNGAYTYGASSLTKGEAYYYIATANNTAGDGSGVEQKFLTKPDLPTGIFLNPGAGEIYIEWNPAAGADKYMVRGSTIGYPADYSDGVEVYFGTDVSTTHTGLGNNETWYYRIWSECSEDGMEQWSDSYTEGSATTDIVAPVITGNAASGVTDNDAILNGTLNDGGEACTVVWYWGLVDAGETTTWTNNSTQAAQVTGTVSYTISGTLTASTTYFWAIRVTNTAGDDWSVSGNFTTSVFVLEILPPADFILIDMGAVSINATWTKDVSANYTMIRALRDTFPELPTDGELVYYGENSTVVLSGYALDVSRYNFSAWGFDSDNITYSSNYSMAFIGGIGMEALATAITSLGTSGIGGLTSTTFTTQIQSIVIFVLLLFIVALGFWKRDRIMLFIGGLGFIIYGFSLWGSIEWLSIITVTAGIYIGIKAFIMHKAEA
jgi:hypothetical protein